MESIITSVNRAIRDGFERIDSDQWEIIQAPGDIIELGGNTAGSGYLKISKSTDQENTESVLLSKFIVSAPFRMGLGVSLSQRLNHQRFSVDFVGVDEHGEVADNVPQPDPLAITAISQSATTATITTALPHGFVPGDRISIYGVSDSRFNYGEVYVSSLSSIWTFYVQATPSTTISSVTATGPANSGFVVKVDPVNGADNALGVFWEGGSPNVAKVISRTAKGPLFNTADTFLGTNHTIAAVPNGQGFADSFNAAYTYDLRYKTEGVIVRTIPMDSLSGVGGTIKRTQVIPEITRGYRVRIRAQNNQSTSRVVAEIITAVKTGTTTTTITTAAPHNLAMGDYIQIYGIRDQVNFVNLTAVTAVASIVSPTQFTVVMGAAATATSYGGAVIKVNGSFTIAPSSQVVQTISRQDNLMTVVGNTTWAGFSIGETVDLWGIVDSTTGTQYPQYEGAYKVANIATTTLTLYSPGANFAALNVGGAVVKRTDLRLHLFRMLDYQRTIVDIDAGNGNTSDSNESIPVVLANSVTVGGGQVSHDSPISGSPMRIGARALTTNYGAVATGDTADLVSTLVGALIQKPFSIPEADWTFAVAAPITAVADTVMTAAAGTGIRNYMTGLQMINTNAVATEVVVKDGTTVIWRGYLPASMSQVVYLEFPTPIRTTANTALNFAAITTGANIYVNAQGYKAP